MGNTGRFSVAFAVLVVLALVCASERSGASSAGLGMGEEERARYIVLFEDSADHPAALSRKQVKEADGRLLVAWKGIDGYVANLPKGKVDQLRLDPRVRSVTRDRLIKQVVATQGVPTGISRINAPGNAMLDIDESDDRRVDADVAVLDTGIDHVHADLNVVSRVDCSIPGPCIANSGLDVNGHGTHVAGTIGALDNGEGVVGSAPGARLWSVKVLFDDGSAYTSSIVTGIEWVRNRAADIEVANMSIQSEEPIPAIDEAVEDLVEKGVVAVVAAGNFNMNAANSSPARAPDAITVSGITDYNGVAGGGAPATCSKWSGTDDVRYPFSNYGSVIDIAAPAVCILSSEPNSYGYRTGTSMAAPLVSGAAAVLSTQSNPNTKEHVEGIRNILRGTGNYSWSDNSGDGVTEPLLDMSNSSFYKPGTTAIAVVVNGKLQVKVGALTGSWVEQSVPGVSIVDASIATDPKNGPVIAVEGANGQAYVKQGLHGSWVNQSIGVNEVTVATDPQNGIMVGVLASDGHAYVKAGLNGSWSDQGAATALAIASDSLNGRFVGVVRSDTHAYVKQGLSGTWVDLTGGVKAISIASDSTNGPFVGVLGISSDFLVKQGIFGSWVLLNSGVASMSMATDSKNGVLIGALTTDAHALVKQGIYGVWVDETAGANSLDVATSTVNGPLVGVKTSEAHALVKQGNLYGEWVDEFGGISEFDLAD